MFIKNRKHYFEIIIYICCIIIELMFLRLLLLVRQVYPRNFFICNFGIFDFRDPGFNHLFVIGSMM